MPDFLQRPGEIASERDPAIDADDGRVVFIGKISTPWKTRDECPKNIRQARARGKAASLNIDAPWRDGLKGLETGSHIIVLYWMHEARRDLIVQAPRHKSAATGVFSLRSPVRPNPIAMATVRIVELDIQNGVVKIDTIDCLDGTPLLDIKPWIGPVDSVV